MILFIFGIITPWILGYTLMRSCVKQRYGYVSFALGAGFVLGLFLTTLILRAYALLDRPFSLNEILLIEWLIILPVYYWLTPKRCTLEEQRLEKAPANSVYLLSGLLFLVIIFRLGLTGIDLWAKPVFPWDGWLSWSAKAKVFFEQSRIPALADELTGFWKFSDVTSYSISGARHPYFVSLIQTYTALAWGSWDERIINVAWVGLGLSMALSVFGGLRYLGMRLLPAAVAAYLVTSLPILDTHLSLGSYADAWVGVAFLLTVFCLSIALTLKYNRLFLVFFVFCFVMYASKNTALVLIGMFLLMVCWHYLSGFKTVALVLLGLLLLWLGSEWLASEENAAFLSSLLASGAYLKYFSYNPVAEMTLNEWLVKDNWHYMFIAVLSICALFLKPQSHYQHSRGLILVIVAGVFACFTILGIAHFTDKMIPPLYTRYINRVTLYFAPVFCLIPACVYQLLMKDENTLPTI